MVGYMPMPADFPHRELFYAGRPQHRKFDDFWCKHPTMDCGRRAKIFSPFDALKGFSDAVSSKEIQYEFRRELSVQRKEHIEEKLKKLCALTANGRVARENKPVAAVEYYVPCTDRNHAAYGLKGRYETYSAIVSKVDYFSRVLFIGDRAIALDNIYSIICD